MRPRIIFHVGGPDFHPSSEQAGTVMDWLGTDYFYHKAEGLAAFEHLNECDLLVLMGMWWTGFEGRYRALGDVHKRALEKYVHSGRPILSAHASIASYDDWPRFGQLVGYAWDWGTSSHSIIAEHRVHILPTGHPITRGIDDFTIEDELYQDIRVAADMDITIHAEADWRGNKLPMVVTAKGGRVAGAGKTVYLANGHDMRAFQCDALRKLWLNAVQWCLST